MGVVGRWVGDLARDEHGQMVVEMAVVTPVMIVVAVVVANLVSFIAACARFDRVAPDAVMACAVSPAGEAIESGAQEHEVAQAIEGAMRPIARVTVEVTAQTAWEAYEEGRGDNDPSVGFSFAPHLTRYVCTLTYRPWPSALSIAGVDAGVPGELRHECAFTIDRYRPGVLF